MPTRESIMCKSSDRRPVANECAAPMLGAHQALTPQEVHRLPDRPARDAVPVDQVLLARQPRAGLKLPAQDRRPQTISDLLEDRAITRWVDGGHHAQDLH